MDTGTNDATTVDPKADAGLAGEAKQAHTAIVTSALLEGRPLSNEVITALAAAAEKALAIADEAVANGTNASPADQLSPAERKVFDAFRPSFSWLDSATAENMIIAQILELRESVVISPAGNEEEA